MNGTNSAGFTVWFTGMSGAGKSTLAAGLANRLRRLGKSVEVLDGGEAEQFLNVAHGQNKDERNLEAIKASLARFGQAEPIVVQAGSRRIIAGAPGVLAGGGALALEIGEGQAPPLAATMRARGFVDVTTRHDLAGVERYLAGAFGAASARGARAARARPAAVRRAEGG